MSKEQAEQAWAEHCLWEAVVMLRKRGWTLWRVIKQAAFIFEHPTESATKWNNG